MPTKTTLAPAQQHSLDFADAALNLAGHQVTDPYLRTVLERHARGEITGDEARSLSKSHILGE